MVDHVWSITDSWHPLADQHWSTTDCRPSMVDHGWSTSDGWKFRGRWALVDHWWSTRKLSCVASAHLGIDLGSTFRKHLNFHHEDLYYRFMCVQSADQHPDRVANPLFANRLAQLIDWQTGQLVADVAGFFIGPICLAKLYGYLCGNFCWTILDGHTLLQFFWQENRDKTVATKHLIN